MYGNLCVCIEERRGESARGMEESVDHGIENQRQLHLLGERVEARMDPLKQNYLRPLRKEKHKR